MPRYPLTDTELEHLVAFLKTLTTDSDPGVTEKQIHFATVIADTVEAEQRKALVDVLNTFVAQKNVETRNESQRAEHAPWHKEWVFGPYRKWVLHIWELQGPEESWLEQLEAQYRAQPVFALLSGLVPGSWQPVHDFCEGFEIPCLFPITDLPVIDFWTSTGAVSQKMTELGAAEILALMGRVGEVQDIVHAGHRSDG